MTLHYLCPYNATRYQGQKTLLTQDIGHMSKRVGPLPCWCWSVDKVLVALLNPKSFLDADWMNIVSEAISGVPCGNVHPSHPAYLTVPVCK